MSLELLVALFAFAVPGALSVAAWDAGTYRNDRTVQHLLGYGLIWSLVGYTALLWLAPIRLTNLLAQGSLSLAQLLRRENISLFCALCTGHYCAGRLASVFVIEYWNKGAWRSPFVTVLGQVLTETVKAERARRWPVRFASKWRAKIVDAASERVPAPVKTAWTWSGVLVRSMLHAEEPSRTSAIYVRNKDGTHFYGRVHRLPTEPRPLDFVAIAEPRCRGTGELWDGMEWPILLVPFSEIDLMLVNPGVLDVGPEGDSAAEGEPAAEAGGGAEGQSSGRGGEDHSHRAAKGARQARQEMNFSED